MIFILRINWKHLKDLQRSFFYSQVPFVDQPVDLVLFSSLYNFAAKNNFKYIITGGNNSTECVRECIDWTYFSTDTKHVRDIHKKFGKISQLSLPMCDIFKYKFYYRFIKQIKVIKLLDYLPFIKENAEKTLNESYGWKPYQMKHYESRFTKFYESFWTPKKHGYDKRRAYLSSLILTKQLRRDQALIRISQNELTDEEMNKDFKYVASIPLTIFYNMQKTGIISKTGKVQDRIAFARFLNDPDNKYLKVTDKKI